MKSDGHPFDRPWDRLADQEQPGACEYPRNAGAGPIETLRLPSLLTFVRMHFRLIFTCLGVCVLLGLAYLITAPPRFAAEASLLIDQPSEHIPNFKGFGGAEALDIATVETQIEILRSQRIALAVVRRLDLATNERFVADDQDILSAVLAAVRRALGGLIPDGDAPAAASSNASVVEMVQTGTKEEEAAVQRLRDRTDVRRAGASYVIDVSYTALDPVLAAAISNALAKAYIEDRRNSRYRPAGEANQWLQVITPASVPTAPAGPRKSLILTLSAILGCGIGLTGAVVRASFDQTIRAPGQLGAAGLICLAVLPVIPGRFRRNRRGRLRPRDLTFAARQPLSEFATALRRAKVTITLAASESAGAGFVIGMASALPGEGKTTVASNLGHIFAQGGQRTIIIDADMHQDGKLLQLAEAQGYPTASLPLEITTLRRLLGAPAGSAEASFEASWQNPADLLASPSMRAALGELRQTHHCIILDLPPVESVADAIAVAPFVDGFLFICEWGQTPRALIEGAVDTLKSHGGTIIGAILNRADLRALRILGIHSSGYGYSQTQRRTGEQHILRRRTKRATRLARRLASQNQPNAARGEARR